VIFFFGPHRLAVIAEVFSEFEPQAELYLTFGQGRSEAQRLAGRKTGRAVLPGRQ